MVSSISQKSEYSENSENKHVRQRKKWEFGETKKYYEFLLKYRSILQQPQKKQKQRIYNKMADCVGTRSTHQCRSHHQKVMKRYDSIDNFIAIFKRKLDQLSDPQKFQVGMNLEQGNEKKKSKVKNKTKLKLKQSSPSIQGLELNIQQELNKLIQINRSSKEKLQIIERIRTLKGFNDKKSFHQTYQPQQKFQTSVPDYLKSSSSKNNINLSQFNSLQNSLPLHSFGKSQTLLGSGQIQSFFIQRKPMNQFSTISNDHINSKYGWVTRVFQNPNLYQRFFSNIYPTNTNQKETFQPDYSYVPLLMREMAQKTLASKTEDKTPQSFLYRQNCEQLIENAPYVCASVIQRENLNVINPYIKQNNIILTQQKIKIPYKKDQDSNVWVQCVKVEQLQQDEMVNSNSEQIERERIKQVLIEVLRNQGVLKNNDVIAQKQYADYNMSSFEIDGNKRQTVKPINEYQMPKIEENPKFNSSFQFHSQKPLSKQLPDQFQIQKSSQLRDQYKRTKLQGKEIDQNLPKTAPSWEDAEKYCLDQYMEKDYEYHGISKNSSFQQVKLLSDDQKRNKFLSAYQNQNKGQSFPTIQQSKDFFNFNSYPFSSSEFSNFPHFYVHNNDFQNYGYNSAFSPFFQQQKNNYGSNIPPSSFFQYKDNLKKGNIEQRRKFN